MTAPKPDPLASAQQAVTAQLRAVEHGRARVHIPRLRGRMRVLPGMPFHQSAELFIQLSGVTKFQFPEERLCVRPGEVCVVPRGMPHGETVRKWRGPFHNLVFMFYSPRVFYHLAHENPPGRPATLAARSCGCAQAQRLAGYLDDAAEIHACGEREAPAALKGLLLAHLAGLRMALRDRALPQKEEAFKIVQARQFVLDHLADRNLSVVRLAEWLRCAPDYLSFLFHQQTGLTLVRYINEQRLARARHLLEASPLTIKEIAVAAGYCAPGYFTRLFHRETGQTPKAYRRQQGQRAAPRKLINAG